VHKLALGSEAFAATIIVYAIAQLCFAITVELFLPNATYIQNTGC
jgi:hypothetical protein